MVFPTHQTTAVEATQPANQPARKSLLPCRFPAASLPYRDCPLVIPVFFAFVTSHKHLLERFDDRFTTS